MEPAFLLLAVLVVFASMVQAIIGFGAMIVILTFAAYLYPIEYLVPVLLPMHLVTCGYLAFRYRGAVDHRQLWKRIVPLAGIGLPIGFVLFHVLQGDLLKRVFGVFVLACSAYQLVLVVRSKEGEEVPAGPLPWWQAPLWLTTGGIIHGIYVSGGPLIVFYASRVLRDKGTFRSTLSVLWLVLNVVLCAIHITRGTINAETLPKTAMLLAPLVAGLLAGDWLHSRVAERSFRIALFGLLVFAGATIAV